MGTDTDGIVSDLYGTPLEEFTERRNEMAKGLKAAGDDETAKVVGSLRKPKLSAWAVNQLVRRSSGDLEGLIEATEEAASAETAASLREAARARQRIIARLAEVAGGILTEAGHAASANTLQEVVQTLQATSDPEAREAVLRGDLAEPLAPSGLGLGTGSGSQVLDDAPTDPNEERRRAEIEGLERDLKKARRAADEAAAAAERARGRAEVAEEQAAEAERDVQRLEDRLIETRGGGS